VFVLLAAAATLGGAAIFLLGILRETPLPEYAVANRPIQVADDGYTSSETCRACHPDQYNTWYASYHRTMTQVATPDTARARSRAFRATPCTSLRPIRVRSATGLTISSSRAWMATPRVCSATNRSLRTLPGLGGVPYDFVAPRKERYQSQVWTLATWDRSRPRSARADAHLLFDGDGNVNVQGVLRLLKERNNRRVLLRE
jgi:hypothetical protein